MIDLTSHFCHAEFRPLPHSFGIPVGSDWIDKAEDDPVFGIYKKCGFWTMDEVNILYECSRLVAPGAGLDIGAHTGFTTAHIAAGGLDVVAVDPMLRVQGFQDRFEENMGPFWDRVCLTSYLTSDEYFDHLDNLPAARRRPLQFDLVCIDADHESPHPLCDAQNASDHLTERGCIALHDFVGLPVREAAVWLLAEGFKLRVYQTVHCVCIAWRGNFTPPSFETDPRVQEQNLPARWPDFDMRWCS